MLAKFVMTLQFDVKANFLSSLTFYTLSRLLHGYLPKWKNNLTHLLPAFVVLISHQKRRCLATEYAGVDKLLLAERYDILESEAQLRSEERRVGKEC